MGFVKYKREEIVKLKRKGLTYREIAKILNIKSLSVIHHHIKESGFQFKSYAELKREIYSLRTENRMLKSKIKKIKRGNGFTN